MGRPEKQRNELSQQFVVHVWPAQKWTTIYIHNDETMLLQSPYNKTLFIDIIENPQGTDFEINLSNLKLCF